MGKTFQEITLVKACMTFVFLIKCHDMYDCVSVRVRVREMHTTTKMTTPSTYLLYNLLHKVRLRANKCRNYAAIIVYKQTGYRISNET